ncbi:MAG: hypothetical protein Q7S61_02000 [bacterium]|nr:hypothetical protein [bacterium]
MSLKNISSSTKAAILLVFVAPAIELFGNTPPIIFFQPLVFFVFLLIYGTIALLIREISIKWKLGLFGLIILGIAYGIFNEGIVAKTLLFAEHVPIPTYDHYGIFFGINFAWFSYITFFHSLHSVIFPILLVYFLFPTVSQTRWVGGKKLALLSGLGLLAGVGLFTNKDSYHADPIYLGVFALMIGALVLLAYFLPKTLQIREEGEFRWKSWIMGVVTFPLYLGMFVISNQKLPLLLYSLYFIVSLFGVYYLLKKLKMYDVTSFLLFGMGSFMFLGFLAIPGFLGRRLIDGVVVILIFEIILTVLLFKIRRRKSTMSSFNKK